MKIIKITSSILTVWGMLNWAMFSCENALKTEALEAAMSHISIHSFV